QASEVVVFIDSHFSEIQLLIVSKVVDRYVLILSQASVRGSEKFSQIKFQGIMMISCNNPNNSSINIQATVRTFVIVSHPVSKEVLTSSQSVVKNSTIGAKNSLTDSVILVQRPDRYSLI